MPGALFVPGQDVLDLGEIVECVVQGEEHSPGESENGVDPFALERFQDHSCCFHLSSSAVGVNGREREPDAVTVLSGERFAATQYRAGLGPGDEGYIAAQHARIVPSRALPRRLPPFHLVVADLHGQ